MKRQFLALSFGIGAMLLATQHVFAQDNAKCAKRDQVIERLTVKYGETRQSIGLAPNTGVVEVYASGETGTWTIVITMPNGMTCLVASGQAFETLAEVAAPEGTDA